ncbi:ABC transporter substrate-binding protein [Marinivivus vitaminiproducens]|uniref:ABC transporter substrate-binding protein n=1 Tax=Marinivivus vitaminiproducens TaxID=3035935 RepID=UPI0027A1BD1A|nr:ABC transporter substrate-binding protein [Geminicoccaceae bacterium SCSIO 64248]
MVTNLSVYASAMPWSHARALSIGFLAGVAILTVCNSPATAQQADLKDVSLTIGIQSSGSDVVPAILEASGAFDDAPYEVTWANFDGANAAVEALNAGAIDLDVGLNFSTPVLNQANASQAWTVDNRPYAIVGANLQLNRAGTAIVVRPDAGIKTVSDLDGRTVTFARGTANHYFFAIAAQEAGLSLDDVTLALMPLSEARGAFVGGAVDALVTNVNNARPLITGGDGVILATSEGLYDSYAWLVARPEVLADPDREAAVADVIKRLQHASLWHAGHVDTVAEIFERVGRQSPEDAQINARESITAYVPIDHTVIAANQRQAEVFFEAGVAANEIDASIGFDHRFNAIVTEHPGPTQPTAGN